MNVSEAVDRRSSIRSFLDKPVDGTQLRELLARAARSPSGGNLQPWRLYVLGGETLASFKAQARETITASPRGQQTEYDIYPPDLVSPYRDRRWTNAEDLYGTLGIPRDNKAARKQWFARNFEFFGAPVGLFCFVNRQMGSPQWSDLGMYLQTVMLLLKEAGLDSCPQECWAMYPKLVHEFVEAPSDYMLFTGMAIGYADPQAQVNMLRTTRADLDEFADFRDI